MLICNYINENILQCDSLEWAIYPAMRQCVGIKLPCNATDLAALQGIIMNYYFRQLASNCRSD